MTSESRHHPPTIDPRISSLKVCRRRRSRLDVLGVKFALFVRNNGGGPRVATLGAAGLIAFSGIVVAVTLAACEMTSGRAAPDTSAQRQAPTPTTARADLPRPPTYTPPTAAPAADPVLAAEPQMRIRIATGVERFVVTAGESVLVGLGDPKGTTALPVGAATEPIPAGRIEVALRGGKWIVSHSPLGSAGAGTRQEPTTYSATSALVLEPTGASKTLTVATPSGPCTYSGSIRLSARSDLRSGTSFDAVEFVGIEDYLPGVVAREMLTGWPLGAYQAQAVAARTYALHERQRSIGAGSGYDVESSDKDQVYGGTTTNLSAREAVRSTRGIVLMAGDKVLRTYYSSTCGGRTAAARDTWPIGPGYEYNLAAPIQEHHRDSACTASPLYRWSVERPRDELVQRFRWFGERAGLSVKRLRDLASIGPHTVNSDGRPSRYKILESDGTVHQLSGEELRLACNTNAPAGARAALEAAPTLAAELGESPGPPGVIPDIDRRTRVCSGDIEVAIQGERVIITGRGFGHGVGLCQYCARAFADRGETWRTMIERFYPGARIVNLY